MVTEVIKALHYLCLATICQYSPMYGSARLYSSLVYLENVALGFGILLFFSALVFFHLWRNSCVHWVEMYIFWDSKSRSVSGTKTVLEFVSFSGFFMLFFKQIKGVQTFIKASVLKCTIPGTTHAMITHNSWLCKYKEIIPMTVVWFFFSLYFWNWDSLYQEILIFL